jgi:transposase-like protein
VYSEISDEMAALLEIEENLARHDLTAEQRKSWAARKLRLVEGVKQSKGVKGDKVVTFEPPTWLDTAETVGMHVNTLRGWYRQYKASHHGKDWNKQSKAEYDGFLDWVGKAEQRKAEDDAKKAEQVRVKQLDAAVQSIKDSIDAAAKKHGKVVYSMIADWLAKEAV